MNAAVDIAIALIAGGVLYIPTAAGNWRSCGRCTKTDDGWTRLLRLAGASRRRGGEGRK
jgi:hypothetical protein